MTSSLHSDPGEFTGAPVQLAGAAGWRERYAHKVAVYALRLALLAAAIICWQLLAGKVISVLFVSKPGLVWHQLQVWSATGSLWKNSWVTIREILLGYAFGAAAGILAGFGLALLRLLSAVLDPFIMALYAIPKVALAPLFIVWFGIGLRMKVILAAVTVFFLVFINTGAGIKQVDNELVDATRLMGASRLQIIRKVILPASMTGVLTGLRIAIPYALIGAVIGELVASNQGLGYLINNSASTLNTAGVFAALVALTVIAAILNAMVNIIGRWTDRWQPSASKL